jgi:hypothetical protein
MGLGAEPVLASYRYQLVPYHCIYVYEKTFIYKDLPFVDPYGHIHRPQTRVFEKTPLTSFSLLTSLDILEKPISHKGPDKPMSLIQNPVVRPTHEIPRLVNMTYN